MKKVTMGFIGIDLENEKMIRSIDSFVSNKFKEIQALQEISIKVSDKIKDRTGTAPKEITDYVNAIENICEFSVLLEIMSDKLKNNQAIIDAQKLFKVTKSSIKFDI